MPWPSGVIARPSRVTGTYFRLIGWNDNDISNIGQCILGLAEAAVCLDNAAYSARLLGALERFRELKRMFGRRSPPTNFHASLT